MGNDPPLSGTEAVATCIATPPAAASGALPFACCCCWPCVEGATGHVSGCGSGTAAAGSHSSSLHLSLHVKWCGPQLTLRGTTRNRPARHVGHPSWTDGGTLQANQAAATHRGCSAGPAHSRKRPARWPGALIADAHNSPPGALRWPSHHGSSAPGPQWPRQHTPQWVPCGGGHAHLATVTRPAHSQYPDVPLTTLLQDLSFV